MRRVKNSKENIKRIERLMEIAEHSASLFGMTYFELRDISRDRKKKILRSIIIETAQRLNFKISEICDVLNISRRSVDGRQQLKDIQLSEYYTDRINQIQVHFLNAN